MLYLVLERLPLPQLLATGHIKQTNNYRQEMLKGHSISINSLSLSLSLSLSHVG